MKHLLKRRERSQQCRFLSLSSSSNPLALKLHVLPGIRPNYRNLTEYIDINLVIGASSKQEECVLEGCGS
jgi:hypothetical protein